MNVTWLKNLLSNAGSTFRRFPHVIICSACCSVLLCFTASPEIRDDELVFRLLFAFSLGIPSFFALALFDERYTMRRETVFLMHGIMAGLLSIYFITIPNPLNGTGYFRYMMLAGMAHLAVSFAPFVVNREMNGFWQFNRMLFMRFLLAALFSLTLFAGLAGAVQAIEVLFKVEFPPKTILYIFYSLLTINTWIFLSGIPRNVELLQIDTSYPKGLKIFSQYVLLPLIVVFALIVYAYTIKIIMEQQWPSSFVAILIMVLAATGTLAFLLLWPLGLNQNDKWISLFTRKFYLVLFPLIIVMGLTAARPIAKEWLTVNRFIVLLLALWLAFICVYFFAGKSRSIKMIPVSLFIAILAAGFAPFNAFDTTRKSQLASLKLLMESNNRMKGEIFISGTSVIPSDEARSISRLIIELSNYNGIRVFEKHLDPSVMDSIEKISHHVYRQREAFFEFLQLERIGSPAESQLYYYEHADPLQISDYDFYFEMNINDFFDHEGIIQDNFPDSVNMNWSFTSADQKLKFSNHTDTVSFAIEEIYSKLNSEKDEGGLVRNRDAMIHFATSKRLSVKLYITNISTARKQGKDAVSVLNAKVLARTNSEK